MNCYFTSGEETPACFIARSCQSGSFNQVSSRIRQYSYYSLYCLYIVVLHMYLDDMENCSISSSTKFLFLWIHLLFNCLYCDQEFYIVVLFGSFGEELHYNVSSPDKNFILMDLFVVKVTFNHALTAVK